MTADLDRAIRIAQEVYQRCNRACDTAPGSRKALAVLEGAGLVLNALTAAREKERAPCCQQTPS